MPRPKSDLVMASFRVLPDDLAALDRIAQDLGLVVEAGASVGKPDRSAALRHLIREADRRLARKARSRKDEG